LTALPGTPEPKYELGLELETGGLLGTEISSLKWVGWASREGVIGRDAMTTKVVDRRGCGWIESCLGASAGDLRWAPSYEDVDCCCISSWRKAQSPQSVERE
jgi:hypothetical protein